MAYVKHEAIHSSDHLRNAFKYDGKVEKVTLYEDSHLQNLFSYASSDKKTRTQLMTFIGCNKNTAYDDFEMAKLIHHKTDKIVAHQYFQSFKPGEGTPELIHKIGIEFAEKIAPLYQVAIYTHVDKPYLHNHIIINSVNLTTGYKFIDNKQALEHIRSVSDDLCRKYGLSIINRDYTMKPLDRDTYKAALKGKSWKVELSNVLDNALLVCQSKKEFSNYLINSGFNVRYYPDNITVQKEGELKGIRVDTLALQFGEQYKKESIEKKLNENKDKPIPERENNPLILMPDKQKTEIENYKIDNIDILNAVDIAAENSRSKDEFISMLNESGFQVKYQNANISIRKKGTTKFRRVDTLARFYGKRYMKEAIEERIKANSTWKYQLKAFLDTAIVSSITRDNFKDKLSESGYIIDYDKSSITKQDTGEHIAFAAFAQIYGGQYSLNAIDKTLYRNNPNKTKEHVPETNQQKRLDRSHGKQFETEWQRYARWQFKQKERDDKSYAKEPDIRMIDNLKRSILNTKNMKLLFVRLGVLALLFMNKDRRLKYKKYKDVKHQKVNKSAIKRSPESKTFQNINYYNLIHSDGENATIRIKPEQVSLLFNQPLFYSAKVYRDGRALVTVKTKDEELLYRILHIDKQVLERDYDIQNQQGIYKRLKSTAAEKGTKLIFRKVDEAQLNTVRNTGMDMSFFVNQNDYTICLLPEDEYRLYSALNKKGDYIKKMQTPIYRNLKIIAEEQGFKLQYRKVNEETLNQLITEDIRMAYFMTNDDLFNVSYFPQDEPRILVACEKQKQKEDEEQDQKMRGKRNRE